MGVDHSDSDRNAQRQRLAIVQEVAAGDHVDQARGGFVRALLVGTFEQDAELVAADPRHHVALAHAALEQSRDLDQGLVAGAMAERVVDRLQSVEVDEQHRSMGVVPANARDQPLELAAEAAAIGKIDQTVLMREMVELLHALLKLRHLPPQPADLLDQPLHVGVSSHLVRHCPESAPLNERMP